MSTNTANVQPFMIAVGRTRSANFPFSMETAINLNFTPAFQFSNFSLTALSSLMLSSELTDQKQININESFVVKEEKAATGPRIGFNMEAETVGCAAAIKNMNTRQPEHIIF